MQVKTTQEERHKRWSDRIQHGAGHRRW